MSATNTVGVTPNIIRAAIAKGTIIACMDVAIPGGKQPSDCCGPFVWRDGEAACNECGAIIPEIVFNADVVSQGIKP